MIFSSQEVSVQDEYSKLKKRKGQLEESINNLLPFDSPRSSQIRISKHTCERDGFQCHNQNTNKQENFECYT